MERNNQQKGFAGEALAVNYLKRKGYEIVTTNWRFQHLEIDIVAKLKDVMVFAEVKLRHDQSLENPRDAVSKSKEIRLINAAEAWVVAHNFDGESRFDLVAITQYGKTFKIEHIENAFNPSF
jgi:putative endonuclease